MIEVKERKEKERTLAQTAWLNYVRSCTRQVYTYDY